MLKIIKLTLISAAIFSLASCASYNSIMPDWAKIGESAETEEVENAQTDGEDDVDWWNPVTWF